MSYQTIFSIDYVLGSSPTYTIKLYDWSITTIEDNIGVQDPKKKNKLKLKSWANFEHKLGKNLRNKVIHLNERTKKGKVKALKSPFPAI